MVTHAVDFVHLADHIIIMKDGDVFAQGSYESLIDHPYIVEITDIHTKNKNALKKANEENKTEEVKTEAEEHNTTQAEADFEMPASTSESENAEMGMTEE